MDDRSRLRGAVQPVTREQGAVSEARALRAALVDIRDLAIGARRAIVAECDGRAAPRRETADELLVRLIRRVDAHIA